jgi:hypothetical protein
VRVVLNQKTSGVDLVGFEELGETVFVDNSAIGYTVVSDHGRGESKNLSLVRRISQALWVTDHTSSKDNLFTDID